jgi:CIC family chloride channel protein
MRNTVWVRVIHQFWQPKWLAILKACLIGLVSALAAITLGQGIGWLGSWRIQIANRFPAYLVLPASGLVLGWLAGFLVERFAPAASGSGMSEVKAVLAKIPMPLNLRIASIKLVSAMLVLGAGMPLGREGPTVQIGAALAEQLNHWFPTSSEHRRQLIAAGAGAGLAAAFNAPIAGILFVVEELLQDVSGITLGTAILASFIAAVVTRIAGSHSLDLDLHLVPNQTSFSASEIPFYLLLGILAGILGVLFNRGILLSLQLNRRFIAFSLPIRIGLAGLISGLAIAFLPATFRDNAGLREILLTGQVDWQWTALAFVSQFLLILLTYGSGAPGGLLIPTMVLGAALGYLVGISEHHFLGAGLATTYARVGMAAFFSSVARVPITGIIIVFEMTTDFNLVLPLMIGSVTAYLVAETLAAGSLYDLLLEFKGIHLESNPGTDELWATLKAKDVMQSKVETISSQISLERALQNFSRSSHSHFPVIEDGKLVGILSQKDLATPLRKLPSETTVREIMTSKPIAVKPFDTLARVLHLLNRDGLNCLPVVEGRKLVGVITRSDVIRAEARYLQGNLESISAKPEPSYVIHQSRVPASRSQGKLLLPLSNPQTAPILVEMAAAIARERHYEIECLHVIVVPSHQVLSEAPVRTTMARRLLQQTARLGKSWQVPVHTQIRVAHDLSAALLDTIHEQHIDLMLMGWKSNTLTPNQIFSQAVDTMIGQAPCQVVLVKLREPYRFNRWLVPMAGGPNAEEAVHLLPALTHLGEHPSVRLLRVLHKTDLNSKTDVLTKAAEFLEEQLGNPVLTTSVRADSVLEAVLDSAQYNSSDAIVLGASREGLLQQIVHGNIPAAISRYSDRTVILVRGAMV